MEEKRNIKVTLEQAMGWYNSGNSTLRTLALSAYTEDELKLNFKYINSKVCNTCFCANVPVDEAEKYNTLVDLAVIAKFFNGSWKKTINNAGYFISNCSRRNNVACTCNGVDIYQHLSVQHAGIIYFKNKEDVIKAIEILGDRVKNLFNQDIKLYDYGDSRNSRNLVQLGKPKHLTWYMLIVNASLYSGTKIII